MSIQPAMHVVIDEYLSQGHGGIQTKYIVSIAKGDDSVYPSRYAGYHDSTCASLKDALAAARYLCDFFDIDAVHRRGQVAIPILFAEDANG